MILNIIYPHKDLKKLVSHIKTIEYDDEFENADDVENIVPDEEEIELEDEKLAQNNNKTGGSDNNDDEDEEDEEEDDEKEDEDEEEW